MSRPTLDATTDDVPRLEHEPEGEGVPRLSAETWDRLRTAFHKGGEADLLTDLWRGDYRAAGYVDDNDDVEQWRAECKLANKLWFYLNLDLPGDVLGRVRAAMNVSVALHPTTGGGERRMWDRAGRSYRRSLLAVTAEEQQEAYNPADPDRGEERPDASYANAVRIRTALERAGRPLRTADLVERPEVANGPASSRRAVQYGLERLQDAGEVERFKDGRKRYYRLVGPGG